MNEIHADNALLRRRDPRRNRGFKLISSSVFVLEYTREYWIPTRVQRISAMSLEFVQQQMRSLFLGAQALNIAHPLDLNALLLNAVASKSICPQAVGRPSELQLHLLSGTTFLL